MRPDPTVPPAIVTTNLTKIYRLYQKPAYKLLDLLGLCPDDPQHFRRHAALSNVGVQIERAQKVAIIGRNGAGKSTLLKLIAGVIRPTSGSVAVNGRISNLLQLGTGFHPEFTGRQNVYANLAHQGISGRDADRAFAEVLEFAEIEEYIDQPMKTYSTGMCSRLMFSASIVLKPEILIVDEILGVGDAYFSHKSFERMRGLCTHEGTTLLLVTHDIYSALNLCDRFLWIDRGQLKADSDGKTAIALYESSIKEQEEHSLRQQNAARLATTGDGGIVHLMFRSRTGFALKSPLALESVELTFSDGPATTLPVAKGAAGWDLLPEGNLGPPQMVEGRSCRVLRTSGSIYHKAEWIVAVPAQARVKGVRVRWHHRGDEVVDLRIFTPERALLVEGTLEGGAAWQEREFARDESTTKSLDLLKQTDYGTGLVRITNVQFLDPAGSETVEPRHGEPLTVRIHARVDPLLGDRHVAFVLGFARHGSPYSAYVYDPSLLLSAGDQCVIDVAIASVRLGSGQWYINIAIGEVGALDQGTAKYFSLDARWHHHFAARLELRIQSASALDESGCFVVHPATITVRAGQPDPGGGATPLVEIPSA